MITYKVKYKKYIANLYVPEQKSGRVVLLLPGLPMSTNINNILKPFLDAGAVVFYPNLSGSYDSGDHLVQHNQFMTLPLSIL